MDGHIPEEALIARVALIYKRDTSCFENYRPISLFNTVYKLMAAIIKRRIGEGIEEFVQATQYGFRKHKRTQDALYSIRSLITAVENSQNQAFIIA